MLPSQDQCHPKLRGPVVLAVSLLVAVCAPEPSAEETNTSALISSGYFASFDATSETSLDSHGDSWTTAWCDNNQQYVMSDDSNNIDSACVDPIGGNGYNVACARLTSSVPTAPLAGTATSCMPAYGTEGQTSSSSTSSNPCLATWKGNGQICVGNTLYMGISRHIYAWNAFGNSGPFCYTNRQKAFDGSIIKSTDFGVTWDAPPPLDASNGLVQFPGAAFGTPSFIQYGKGMNDWLPLDGARQYVYVISNDGYWTTGNAVYLARALRTSNLIARASWQYLTKVTPPTWGPLPPVLNSNASFESVDSNAVPLDWQLTGGAVSVASYSSFSSGNGSHWGGRAVRVANTTDSVWRAITGLTAGRVYTLTGFVRTSATSESIAIGVTNFGGTDREIAVSSTQWTRLSVTFVPTGANAKIHCWKKTGTRSAFCDDLQLTGSAPPVPILSAPGGASVTQAQYIPPSNGAPGFYLMPQWYFPNTNTICTSRWAFYIAERPWGPWTKLDIGDAGPDGREVQWSDCTNRTKGYYNPTVVPKWIGSYNPSTRKRDVWFLYGGDFGSSTAYKLYRMKMVLTYPADTASVLANGSFESGVAPWEQHGPTAAIVNNNTQSGSYSARMSTVNEGFSQDVTGLIAGATYQLSGFLKVASAAEEVRIGVKNYGGTELSNPVNRTSYKQAIINFTPTGETATVYCWKWSGTGYGYCDNLQLTKL